MAARIQQVPETLALQAGQRATTMVTLIVVIVGGFAIGRLQRWAEGPAGVPLLRSADQRLLAAAGAGDASGVAEALRAGASANACDDGRVSALNLASIVGNEASVRLLLDAGADVAHSSEVDTTPLSDAAGNGHATIVELLLDRGAAASPPVAPRMGTALYRAAVCDHLDCIRLLLRHGADPNLGLADGSTPLMVAACWADDGAEAEGASDRLETARLLIDAGATLDPVDREGHTAIDYARKSGSVEMVELLSEAARRRRLAHVAPTRSLQGTDAWRTIADRGELTQS